MQETDDGEPLEPHRSILATYSTKTELVYAALRRAITTGEYPPGSRIVVDRVAAEYEVSKVPVREAVLRLAGEGWLELNAHVGATVPALSPDEALETSIVRAALEGVATRLACEHLGPADFASLHQLLERMEVAAAMDSAEYPELNRQFHSAIVATCPYPLLRDLVRQMTEKAMRLRAVTHLPHYLPETQSEHRALLAALEDRDAARSEELSREHVERAGHLLWQFALEHQPRPRARRERSRAGR